MKDYIMSYKQQNNQNTAPKADGFLNLVILDSKGKPMVDGNGREIRLRKGIALDRSNRIERSLLNAAGENPEFTVALQGSVHISEAEEEGDIVFG